MSIIVTQVQDIPKNTFRWWLKKGRDTNFALAKQLGALKEERNSEVQLSVATELPNGKIRVTNRHTWNTQADLEAYQALINPFNAERDAYNTANNINFTETITEE